MSENTVESKGENRKKKSQQSNLFGPNRDLNSNANSKSNEPPRKFFGHDVEEDQLWLEERSGVYLVHARLELDDFFEQTGVNLKDQETEEEYDTIGGLVSSLTNRIPVRGEVIRDKMKNEYSVVDADPRSIKRLRVFLARPKEIEK